MSYALELRVLINQSITFNLTHTNINFTVLEKEKLNTYDYIQITYSTNNSTNK